MTEADYAQGGAGVRPSVLPHPLEELQAVGVEGGPWQGDSVVWASREVPFVATCSPARARMAVHPYCTALVECPTSPTGRCTGR